MDPMGVFLQVFEERRAVECPWEMNSPGAVVGESCWWLVWWVIDMWRFFFVLEEYKYIHIYLSMNIMLFVDFLLMKYDHLKRFFAENDTSVTHCFLYTVLGCILIYFMRQNRATDIPHLSLLPGHHGHWRTFSRSIREAQTCTSEVSAGSVPFLLGVGVQVKDGWRCTWWNCRKYSRQPIFL